MVKAYKYLFSNTGLCVTGHLCLVIFFVLFFVSSLIQAEPATNVKKYTLQREKAAELTPSVQQAGKPPEIEISEQSGVYHIKVLAVIDAPMSYVCYVLTDYTHIYRLNPSIIESEVLKQHDDGSVQVRTKVEACAAYFCEQLERVDKIQQLPSGDLYAEIISEKSQFKSGQTFWSINSNGDNTEVKYAAEIETDIFIPPVVGKFLIKKAIRQEIQTSFKNLEKIAGILAERAWQDNYQPVYFQAEAKVKPDSPCNNRVINLSANND